LHKLVLITVGAGALVVETARVTSDLVLDTIVGLFALDAVATEGATLLCLLFVSEITVGADDGDAFSAGFPDFADWVAESDALDGVG
jgi:hypothetical protein